MRFSNSVSSPIQIDAIGLLTQHDEHRGIDRGDVAPCAHLNSIDNCRDISFPCLRDKEMVFVNEGELFRMARWKEEPHVERVIGGIDNLEGIRTTHYAVPKSQDCGCPHDTHEQCHEKNAGCALHSIETLDGWRVRGELALNERKVVVFDPHCST